MAGRASTSAASTDRGPADGRGSGEDAAGRERGPEPASGWTLSWSGIDATRERAVEALCSLGSGRIGTRGALAVQAPSSEPGVRVAGVYRGTGPSSDLLPGPVWNLIAASGPPLSATRELDLRAGVLRQTMQLPGGAVEAIAFASLAAPSIAALRVRAPQGVLSADQGLADPRGQMTHGDRLVVRDDHGSIAAAVADGRLIDSTGHERLDRVAAYAWSAHDAGADAQQAAVAAAKGKLRGFDALLDDHRRAWAARWATSDVAIEGDAGDQLALRLALYHLVAATPSTDEAPVGARGLSGGAYRGHVFWDAEAFVLPFHAATEPRCARAMLEYRIARLPEALAEARARGRAGACFPWESAGDGDEVTPLSGTLPTGEVVPIRTGMLEDHIVADIAWAAQHYVAWSGDQAFAGGPGLRLLIETARFWATRLVVDAGAAHIRGVIGPDEYHEDVDDNAYTNVMAQWNLRAAAAAAQRAGELAGEAEHWRRLADLLVDQHDPGTGLYEQFSGFFDLEPLIVADVLPSRPAAAPAALGQERVAGAQVLKQADVLMLHYLVPDAVAPGSLRPNLDFYEPRTAHGSTLSPGVHAALLARASRPEDALRWLRLTSRIDLDDLSGTTAGGVHLAAMGSAWRTVAWGFAGLTATPEALVVDPRPLPAAWEAIETRVRYRGTPVRVRVTHDAVSVLPDTPIPVRWSPSSPVQRVGSGSGPQPLQARTTA